VAPAAPNSYFLTSLLAGDADVSLDLQLALATVYDAVGYDLAVNYREVPPIPLSVDETRWMRETLRLG
jgi:hypothetical protein